MGGDGRSVADGGALHRHSPSADAASHAATTSVFWELVMNALTISVALLWVAVLVLAVLLWAISRQVGVLFERVAPMGALVTDSGPPVGTPSPIFQLTGIQSEPVQIGGEQATPSLVFFLSPTCPVCKKLLPVLKAVAHDERQHLRIVLASDGEAAEHLQFVQQLKTPL